MRAALQPSFDGQNVSSANTMPGLISYECSSDTRRLITGFSQMASPMPWPNCSAKAASSLGKPNSCALGHTDAISPVVRPGRMSEIAAARVRVDQGVRCVTDAEAAVIAGAIAHERMQNVVVHGVAGPQHAVGKN